MISRKDFKQMVESLRKLGIKTYEEYLSSELWAKTRERLSKTKPARKNKCFYCGLPAHVWHHIRYNSLSNEQVNTDVVRCCERCHDLIHHVNNTLVAIHRQLVRVLKKVKKKFWKRFLSDKEWAEGYIIPRLQPGYKEIPANNKKNKVVEPVPNGRDVHRRVVNDKISQRAREIEKQLMSEGYVKPTPKPKPKKHYEPFKEYRGTNSYLNKD